MTLAATQGTELAVSATGPETAEVLEALVRLFADEFGVAYGEGDGQQLGGVEKAKEALAALAQLMD